MRKNTASQVVGAQMVSATDGSAFTGSVTVYVTGDGGTQAVGSVGSGACTHEGNGFHTYAPAQAETNYDHVAFTFTGTGAVPATVQVYPSFPQTGDSYARLGAPAGASIAADIATVDSNVDAILVDTGTTLQGDITAILADTNELQTDWANGGRLDLIVDAILDDTGTAGVAIGSSTLGSIADSVWDEATSGHVAAGSFGQALGGMASGTAQAGASTTITLAAGASASDDFYNNYIIKVTGGTGAGQSRIISDYNGTTKVATVPTWGVNPSSDSVYVILPFGAIPGASAPTAAEVADAVWDEARADHTSTGSFGQSLGGLVIRSATAQAGTTSTITLDASASATNDIYNYNQIVIIGGTGAGQSRQITDYVGSSKVATVGVAFTTAPSSDSVFMILPLGVDAATVAAIADAVWDEQRGDHNTAGSFGEYTFSDAVRISGDATAANNCESFFDGTGYAGTNNVIPTVTTVTTLTGHTPQTGDAFARLGAPAGASVSADIAAVKAETASIVADTNEVQTDLANGGRLDLLIDGIKAKTDSLTFTKAGEVDANVQSVNGVTITGDGSGTPFGV